MGNLPVSHAREAKLTALGAEIIRRTVYDRSDLTTLGREDVDKVVDACFVALTRDQRTISEQIYKDCKRLRIPVNVVDEPDLCTFTLLSVWSDGDFSLGVTTGGKGCRLANRIKRHCVTALPADIGQICQHVGELRATIQKLDNARLCEGEDEEDAEQSAGFNKLVHESDTSAETLKTRRMRWLSQIVEYYPLSKLGQVSIEELSQEYKSLADGEKLLDGNRAGRISLVGSGPGSVSLLTTAAHQEIEAADLVLADKLVPQEVLDLIPRRTPVYIAKKFPGNAERAQQELLERGLEALKDGKHVIRLKQGDPYIFGRGAEEYIFFSEHGYQPRVIPGVTSALAAPLLAEITPTHRNVADQLLVCTGTGRGGKLPEMPEWVQSRTTVFLMALHRIGDIVQALVDKGWDIDVPTVTIERASCPDQRIIRTTLRHIAEAIEQLGSRPPGLLVIGYACQVIKQLPADKKWMVEEGL